MKCYMDCVVSLETFGRGRNARKRWTIRDYTWNHKLVAWFTEHEFFHGGPDGLGVDDTRIIIDWCRNKKNDPEWQKFQMMKEMKAVEKMIDAM